MKPTTALERLPWPALLIASLLLVILLGGFWMYLSQTDRAKPDAAALSAAHENLLPPLQGEGRGGDGGKSEGKLRQCGQDCPHPPPNLPLEGGGENLNGNHAIALPAQATAPPVDIFAVRTWEPEAPAAVASTEPPPEPEAPPLPFQYLGKIAAQGRNVAFVLAEGERLLLVSVGQTIGKDYRVERYRGGQLSFIYRPLQIRQSLPVGRLDMP